VRLSRNSGFRTPFRAVSASILAVWTSEVIIKRQEYKNGQKNEEIAVWTLKSSPETPLSGVPDPLERVSGPKFWVPDRHFGFQRFRTTETAISGFQTQLSGSRGSGPRKRPFLGFRGGTPRNRVPDPSFGFRPEIWSGMPEFRYRRFLPNFGIWANFRE
jgi:hypothetical protein